MEPVMPMGHVVRAMGLEPPRALAHQYPNLRGFIPSSSIDPGVLGCNRIAVHAFQMATRAERASRCLGACPSGASPHSRVEK